MRSSEHHHSRVFDVSDAPVRRFDARLQHLRAVEQAQRDHGASRRLERELRDGLSSGEFRVHYQPIVTLPDARIVGVEALVRWEHPDRGMVPPIEFIPVAEHTGLIVDLGRWVLEEACRQVRTWQDSVPALRHLRVAVNLSVHQITPDLVSVVANALERSGLRPESLELEITESVVMADIDGALEILDALSVLGVGLSVDDFGTGFSSLAYLKRLPVTGLKIDKAFIDDLPDDPRDVSIVGAVIALAAGLGLTQIAEGVETEAQREKLEALGCAHAQGYLFSRPLPAEAFLQGISSLMGERQDRSAEPGVAPVRVLVCDDDASIRRLYRRALQSGNVEVTDAVDADDCLEKLTTSRPDLVILDVTMPGRGGLEILSEVRSLRPTAHVVMVSGLVTADIVASAQADGADACVAKMQFLPRLGELVEACRR